MDNHLHVIFGNGDIGVGVSEENLFHLNKMDRAFPIGTDLMKKPEHVPGKTFFSAEFKSVESLDVVINSLNFLKKRLEQGESEADSDE